MGEQHDPLYISGLPFKWNTTRVEEFLKENKIYGLVGIELFETDKTTRNGSKVTVLQGDGWVYFETIRDHVECVFRLVKPGGGIWVEEERTTIYAKAMDNTEKAKKIRMNEQWRLKMERGLKGKEKEEYMERKDQARLALDEFHMKNRDIFLGISKPIAPSSVVVASSAPAFPPGTTSAVGATAHSVQASLAGSALSSVVVASSAPASPPGTTSAVGATAHSVQASLAGSALSSVVVASSAPASPPGTTSAVGATAHSVQASLAGSALSSVVVASSAPASPPGTTSAVGATAHSVQASLAGSALSSVVVASSAPASPPGTTSAVGATAHSVQASLAGSALSSVVVASSAPASPPGTTSATGATAAPISTGHLPPTSSGTSQALSLPIGTLDHPMAEDKGQVGTQCTRENVEEKEDGGDDDSAWVTELIELINQCDGSSVVASQGAESVHEGDDEESEDDDDYGGIETESVFTESEHEGEEEGNSASNPLSEYDSEEEDRKYHEFCEQAEDRRRDFEQIALEEKSESEEEPEEEPYNIKQEEEEGQEEEEWP